MVATHVEVVKNQNEANATLVRRFTKKVQSAGLVKHVRTLRFRVRSLSVLKKKEKALKRITRKKETERLKKLGKTK